MEKIRVKYKGKNAVIEVKPVSILSTGLIFRSRETRNLLFEFKKPVSFKITAMFVFFPFVAVWLDRGNNVIEAKVIKPFTFSVLPRKPFVKLVEIPINKRNKTLVKLFSRR